MAFVLTVLVSTSCCSAAHGLALVIASAELVAGLEAEAVCRMVEGVEGKVEVDYRAVAETTAEGISRVIDRKVEMV